MITTREGSRHVTVRVPAKVNLELNVGPRRADGYHDLATVFHAVGLYDDVTVEPAADWEVVAAGPYAEQIPLDESNLALLAARRVAQAGGVDTPVRITIDKQIPVAGGMAGGSADGAAALVACDALWGLELSRPQLDAMAGDLGSDVAFALTGGTAIGSGRGESLAPVLARGSYHWVFAISEGGLSTPAVYAECDRMRGRRRIAAPEPSDDLMAALRSGDPQALGSALSNDLQEAAFSLRPPLRDLLAAGLEMGALGGVVSASGAGVAFLAADAEGALDLAVALAAVGSAPEVKRATGPAHGAHVLSHEMTRGR
jgi:4-diphosphocytidyl-2-C-methyl-D-erythritol kinase